MKAIRSNAHLPLFAMIRPRGGDFHYSPREVEQMKTEIEALKENNLADGFVFGCLLPNGDVDVAACKLLLQACSPLPATFHRAFDHCSEPIAAMHVIAELGFKRILTSGQQATAERGIELLKALVAASDDKIIIMPGCGINPTNLESILHETKAKEFHASASKVVQSEMSFRRQEVSMGNESSDYQWSVCDEQRVRCMIAVADRF